MTRDELIIASLRPAIVGPLRLLSLPKVRDCQDWQVWCECHADWTTQVSVTGHAAEASAGTLDFRTHEWNLARSQAEQEHHEMVAWRRIHERAAAEGKRRAKMPRTQ